MRFTNVILFSLGLLIVCKPLAAFETETKILTSAELENLFDKKEKFKKLGLNLQNLRPANKNIRGSLKNSGNDERKEITSRNEERKLEGTQNPNYEELNAAFEGLLPHLPDVAPQLVADMDALFPSSGDGRRELQGEESVITAIAPGLPDWILHSIPFLQGVLQIGAVAGTASAADVNATVAISSDTQTGMEGSVSWLLSSVSDDSEDGSVTLAIVAGIIFSKIIQFFDILLEFWGSEALIGELDTFFLSVPQELRQAICEGETASLCILFDRLSYSLKSLYKIITRLVVELLDGPDEGDIIEPSDFEYFLEFPLRLNLCGLEITTIGDSGFISCAAANLLPLIPILYRVYMTTFVVPSFGGGKSLPFPASLEGTFDPLLSFANLRIEKVTYDFVNRPGGINDLTDEEFEAFYDDFETGMERIVYYESPLEDKTFTSVRVATNIVLPQDTDGICENFRSKQNLLDGDMDGTLSSLSMPDGVCQEESFHVFLSAGIKNALTCEAIEETTPNYMGSNCKVMTMILEDRMECDEALRDHLFNQYCNDPYDDSLELLVKNAACAPNTECAKPMAQRDWSECGIVDLPIYKGMFMPNGELPKFLASLPPDEPGARITDENLEAVTAIPTIFTMRHFGTNQLPVLDLAVLIVNTHLLGAQDSSTSDRFTFRPIPPPTASSILADALRSIFPFDDFIQSLEFIFTRAQDPFVIDMIYQYFLDSDPCGPTFPLAPRENFREFFGLNGFCDGVTGTQRSPVDDYASIFSTIPLLADVGKQVTVLTDESPYDGRHAYNNDHDLLGLTISMYFGVNKSLGQKKFKDIFDYIQFNIMRPLGINRHEWYFPGQQMKSAIAKGDLVALTIERSLGVVADLLPVEEEQASLIASPYAEYLSKNFAYLDNYYQVNSPSPWLGQGTCFVSTGAWTRLYEDHYVNWHPVAVTPQGYTFRDGSPHQFALISGNPWNGWSSAGATRSASELVDVGITDENCVRFEWGAYSGGAVEIIDCPASNCAEDPAARDIMTFYKTNQLDFFSYTFPTFYIGLTMLLLLGMILDPERLPEEIVLDGDPAVAGEFLFSAFNTYLTDTELPPVNNAVVQACAASGGLSTPSTCSSICSFCDNEVLGASPVCSNEFVSANSIPLSALGGSDPFSGAIGDDRSINCNDLSSWDSFCGTADTDYC